MLEIEFSPFKIYAFTLRKTSNPKTVTKEIYAKHLCHLSHGGQFANFNNIVFESTSGLHCHGIVTIHSSVGMHRFRVRGWNLKLVEIYDLQQWEQYLNKDQDDLLPDMIDPPDDFVWPTKKLF